MMRTTIFGTLVGLALLVGCGGDGPHRSVPPFPAPSGTLTFNRDIAPIVHANCAGCHRPGESAPFSLLDYEDVHERGKQIVEVVTSGYMPPWLPGRGAYRFREERGLADDAIGRLAQWVSEGGPRGELPAPQPPRFAAGWQHGQPDLVLELPRAYSLDPGGFDVFRNFVYRIPLERTRWIRALEFRPGDSRAVHHATIAVDRTPGSRLQDERDPAPGFDGMINTQAQRPDGHLLGWVPGKMPYVVDPAIAWRLDPGDDLVVQLHMQPSGRRETVRPTVGLFFSDEPATRTPFLLRLGSLTMDIPAGDRDYTIEDYYVLPVAATLLGVVPHAHYVGRRMSFWAIQPDGTRMDLLEIPDWDFNWQDEYRYADPVALPAGTALGMRYVYDNSAENPRNPSIPPVRVRFGPNTTDEMGDLWIQVLPDDETLLPVLAADFALKDLRAQVEGYRRYLGNAPGDVPSRVELGRALQALGRLDEARAEYRAAVDTDPAHAVARLRLAEALRLSGSLEESAAEYARVIEQLPELPEIHFNYGQTLLALGHAAEAERRFRHAVELQPVLAEGYNALAGIAMRRGDLAAAEQLYEQAVARDPEYAPGYNNLGSLLARSGRLDEAADRFRAAIEADPAYAPAHDNLGKIAASRGAWEEAVARFTTAARLDPGYEPARRNLERARRMAGH